MIFGRVKWENKEVYLSQSEASFLSEARSTHTGFSTSGLIDYDGDGYDDILIGARFLSGPYYNSGKLYLIKGKQSGWQHDYNLSNNPDYFWGDDTISCAGWQVVDIGDINGDGAHDFVTSGPFNGTGAHWGGKIYLFYGTNTRSRISGLVKYYSNQYPVPNVKLTLTSDRNDSSLTKLNGSYSLMVPKNKNCVVIPSKRLEQKDNQYTVSAYDAALTARHAVKLDTLSRSARTAADVDQDQKVTMYDAALIARYAVDLPALDGSNAGVFLFDPQSRRYQQTQGNYENENYTATVLGDVDGNWDSGNLNKTFVFDSTPFLPEKVFAYQNSEIIIPIRLTGKDSVISADIRIDYDPACLIFCDVITGGATKNFQLLHNQPQNGTIKIAMYTTEKTSLDGELVQLIFKMKDSAKQQATGLNVPLLWLNGCNALSDKTTIYFVDKRRAKNDVMLSAQPNPFNPATKIYFQNEIAGTAQIRIFDVLGREVREFEIGYLQPGLHELYWDGKDNNGIELASGVYLVKFVGEKETHLTKIIKLK